GWTVDQAITFHRGVYRAIWGSRADLEACKAEVVATFEKHNGGFQTTGKRSLEELVDRRAVRAAMAWLGMCEPEVREDNTRKESARAVQVPRSISMEDLM